MSDAPHGGSDGLGEVHVWPGVSAHGDLKKMGLACKDVTLAETAVPEGVQVVEGLASELGDGPGAGVEVEVLLAAEELLVAEELPERVVLGTLDVGNRWGNRCCDTQLVGVVCGLRGQSHVLALWRGRFRHCELGTGQLHAAGGERSVEPLHGECGCGCRALCLVQVGMHQVSPVYKVQD